MQILRTCAGYIDDICHIHGDSTPIMIGLFNGEICIVNGNELCDEVYINAERFAVNSKFTCRVVVSIEHILTRVRIVSLQNAIFTLSKVFL